MNNEVKITDDDIKIINKDFISIKSPSKINFGLWVKERRPDNYHEIKTIFFENFDLCDEIKIEFVKDKKSSINISFVQGELNQIISNEENLAYKAAKLFFEKLKIEGHCNIKINKNIPLKAGLGGGSSNSACVLKGLNQIFGCRLHENELLILAEKIGSDVPFFILGKTCLGKGRGEMLTPLENKLKLQIKIFKPGNISISTKWAYEQIDAREFQNNHEEQLQNLIQAMKKSDYNLFFKNIFNDFEMVVFSYHPELINIRKKLLDEGCCAVGLCGSGSAIFGIKKC